MITQDGGSLNYLGQEIDEEGNRKIVLDPSTGRQIPMTSSSPKVLEFANKLQEEYGRKPDLNVNRRRSLSPTPQVTESQTQSQAPIETSSEVTLSGEDNVSPYEGSEQDFENINPVFDKDKFQGTEVPPSRLPPTPLPTAQAQAEVEPEDDGEIETYDKLLEKEGYDGNNLANKEKFIKELKRKYEIAEDDELLPILNVYDNILRRWLSSTDEKLVYYVILLLKYGYIFRIDRKFKFFKNEPQVLKEVIFKNWKDVLRKIYYSDEAFDFYRRRWQNIYQDLNEMPYVNPELIEYVGLSILQLLFSLLDEDIISDSTDLFLSDIKYDDLRFSETRNDDLKYDKTRIIQLLEYLSNDEETKGVVPEVRVAMQIDVLCMHINTILSSKYDIDYAEILNSSKAKDCDRRGKMIPSLENIRNDKMLFCKTDPDGCCNKLEDFKNEVASIIANTQLLETKEKVLDMSLRGNVDYYDEFNKDIEKMSGLKLDDFQVKILTELVGKDGINNDLVSLLSSGQHDYDDETNTLQHGGGKRKGDRNRKKNKEYLDGIILNVCEKRHKKNLSALKKNKWCTDEEKKQIRKQLNDDKEYKKIMLSTMNVDQNEYHRVKESVKKSLEKIDMSNIDQEDYDHILKKNKQIRRYKKYKKHKRRLNGDITDSDISTDSSNTSSESEAEDLYPRDKKLFKNRFHDIVYPHKLNKHLHTSKKESKNKRGGNGNEGGILSRGLGFVGSTLSSTANYFRGVPTETEPHTGNAVEKSVVEQVGDTIKNVGLTQAQIEKQEKLNKLRAAIDDNLVKINEKPVNEISQQMKDEVNAFVTNIENEEEVRRIITAWNKANNKKPNSIKNLIARIKNYYEEKNKPDDDEPVSKTVYAIEPTLPPVGQQVPEEPTSAITRELEEIKTKLQNKEIGIGEKLSLNSRKYNLEQKLVSSGIPNVTGTAAIISSSMKLVDVEAFRLKDDEKSLPFRLRNAYLAKVKQLKSSGEIKLTGVNTEEKRREYSSPEEEGFEKHLGEDKKVGVQYNYVKGEDKIDVTAINEQYQAQFGSQDSMFVNLTVELEEVIEKPQEDMGGEEKEDSLEELKKKLTLNDFLSGDDVSVEAYLETHQDYVPFIVSTGNSLTGNALKWPTDGANPGSDFSGKEFIECKDDAPASWQANGYCKLVKEPNARTFVKVLIGGAPVLVLKPEWYNNDKIEGTGFFKLVDTKNDVLKFMAEVFSSNCALTNWDKEGTVNFKESGGADHCNQTEQQKVYFLKPMELNDLRQYYSQTKLTIPEKRTVQYVVREIVLYEQEVGDENDTLATAYREGKTAVKKLFNANAKEEIKFVRKHTIEYVNKTDNGLPKVIVDYNDQSVELLFLKVKESFETQLKNMGTDCYDANGQLIMPLSIKCAGVLKSKQELIEGLAAVEKTKQELVTEGKMIGKTLWQKIVEVFDPAPGSFIQQLWVLLLEVLEKAVRYFFAMDWAKDKLWEKLNDENASYFTRALALVGYPAVTSADYMLKTFMYLLRHPRVITALLKYFETMRDSVCRWFKLKWYSFWKSRGKSPEDIDKKQIQIRNQNNEERKKWFVDIKENFLLFNDAMINSLPEGSKVGQLMGGFGTFLVGIPVIGPTFDALLKYLAMQVPGAAKNIMDLFFIRSGFGRLVSFFNVTECVSGELRVDERFYIVLKVGRSVQTDYGILKNMLKLSDNLFGRKESREKIELQKKQIEPSTGTYAETENEEKEKKKKEIEQRFISTDEFDDEFELENREYYTVESLAMAIVKSEEEYCYKNEEIDDPRYANSKEKQYKELKLLRQEIKSYQSAETRSLLDEIINKVQEKMRTLVSIENLEKTLGKGISNGRLQELNEKKRELEQELSKFSTEPGSKILTAVTRKAEIERDYKKSLSIVRIRENKVKELKEKGEDKRTAEESAELISLQEELDNCEKNSLDINDYDFYSKTIKSEKQGDKIPTKDDLKKFLYEDEIADIIKVNVENILNDDVKYVKFGAYFYNNWISEKFEPGSWFFNDKMIYLTERVYRFFNRFHELGVSSTLWSSIFVFIAANVQNIAVVTTGVGTALQSAPIPVVSAVGTGIATLSKLILSSKYVADMISLGILGIGGFLTDWLDQQHEAAGKVNTVDYVKTQINMSTRTFFGIALFSTTFDEIFPAMMQAAEAEKARFGDENKLTLEEVRELREEARKRSGTSEIYTIKTFSEYIFSLNKRVSKYNDFVNLRYTKQNEITYQNSKGETIIVGKGAVNEKGQLVDDRGRLVNEEGYLIINGKVTDHRSANTEINKSILIQPSDFYYEIDTAAQGKRSILTDEELKSRVEEESLNLLREMEKEEIASIIKSRKEDSEINTAPVSVDDLLSGVVLTDNILFVEKGKQITVTNPDKTFTSLDELLKSSYYEKILQAMDSFVLFFNAELTETYVEHNKDLSAAVTAANLSFDNPLNDWFLLQRLFIVNSFPERNEERLQMELTYQMLRTGRNFTINDRINTMLTAGWWNYMEIEDYTDQENDNNCDEAYSNYKDSIDNLVRQIFEKRDTKKLKSLKQFTEKGISLKLLYQQVSYKSKVLAISYYFICEQLFKYLEENKLETTEREVYKFLDNKENTKLNEWITLGQITPEYFRIVKKKIFNKVYHANLFKTQIQVNNDYITFVSREIEDTRKNYKNEILKMRGEGTYSSGLEGIGRILDIATFKKNESIIDGDEFYLIPPSLRYLRGTEENGVRLGDLALSVPALQLRGRLKNININDKNFVYGIAKAKNKETSIDELFVGGLSVQKQNLVRVLSSRNAIKSAILYMRGIHSSNFKYKGYTMFLSAFYMHLTHQPNINKTMEVQNYGSAKFYLELDAFFEDSSIDKTIEDNREVICSSLIVSMSALELFFPWSTDIYDTTSGQRYLDEKDYECINMMRFLDSKRPIYNNNNNFMNFMIYEKTGDYKRSTNHLDETRTSLPYTLRSGDIIPIINEVLMSVRGTKVESEFVPKEPETRPPFAPTPTLLTPVDDSLGMPKPGPPTRKQETTPPTSNPLTPVNDSFVPKTGSVREKAKAFTKKGGKSKRLIRGPDEVKKTVSAPRALRSGTLRRHVTSNNANKTLKIHSLS